MDLSDLSDFTDFDPPSSYIDNESLDFGQFEQFMSNGQHEDANAQVHNGVATQLDMGNTRIESPSTTPMHNAFEANLSLAAVNTRVNLASTPIATPMPIGNNALSCVSGIGNQTHTHLPESPPDSGSEPPYSPLQVTIAPSDLYNGILPQPHQQQQQLHDLHMKYSTSPPPPPPTHTQDATTTPAQHHYIHQMNAPSTQDNGMQQNISVKHEAGLIMSPGVLMSQHLQQQQSQHQHQHTMPHHQMLQQQQQQQPTPPQQQHHQQQPPQQQQHDIQSLQPDPHQLIFQPINSLMHYDNMPLNSGNTGGLYSSTSYQNLPVLLGGNEQMATCMLASSAGEATRVQVIGTSQASLDRSSVPSTPVHSSTRKRKMSTQPDCTEFGHLKHNPGLTMSPMRSSHHSLSPTSPIRTNLSAANSNMAKQTRDVTKTPVHSHSSASASPALSAVHTNTENSLDGHSNRAASVNGAASNVAEAENGDDISTPCIRFSSFQSENWHKLCDQSLQELSVVYYRVDADKGFNFSVADDAFVCQKKNHFQVTCHARLQGDATFVKTPSGFEKINSFHLHFYGVKQEAPNQTIRVEQSQSDRSKKPFYPVPIDLQSHIVSKVTVGRLHFSETTNNNMRKKGRPNPEQRYFQLVVGLHVHTTSGNFPIISQCSERIIVRASNPGQFESDVDHGWQRGLTPGSITHTGNVGINTDHPDESLVVHGNLKVSGHIVQPSDSRAKQEIGELDTSVQLRNMQKIRIVRYRYEPQFAVHSGLTSSHDSRDIVDTGVIAQEVREVIPDAVQEAGSIVLPNGNVIEKFLLVNKDRILMENIGAVKELCKVTGSLEMRIEHLERAKTDVPRSLCGPFTISTRRSATGSEGYEICSSRTLQIIIFLLIIVMAACLATVSTLYFVEHNKQQHNIKQLQSYQVYGNGYNQADQDRYIQHNFHTFLNKNKTLGHWPSLIYAMSTTRPPAKNETKPREELLTNNNTGDAYELRAVMEKPQVPLQFPKLPTPRITTTAPILRNKTISNKNKIKWPLAQDVLRAAQAANQNSQKLSLASRNLNTPNFAGPSPGATVTVPSASLPVALETYISNETSSEKAPESVPVPQDFENNSIDIDAQHTPKKTLGQDKLGNVVSAAVLAANEPKGEVASQEETLVNGNSDTDITLKLSDQIVVETIASTSSSNSINVPDTTAAAGQTIRKLNTGDAVIYNIYKPVSPPTSNLALTTNKVNTESTQTNISVEAPSTTTNNNSRANTSHDSQDAVDLQNLSNNNNESADNPITAVFGFEYSGLRESSVGRRSASQRSVEWVTQKTIKAETFGEANNCKDTDQPNDKCQSVCFEEFKQDISDSMTNSDNRQLQTDSHESSAVSKSQVLVDLEIVSGATQNLQNETQKAEIVPGKESHATDAVAKQFSDEQGQESTETDDVLESILSPEHMDIAPKIVADINAQISSSVAQHEEQQQRLPLEAWAISTYILGGQLNRTIDVEQFYPSLGKSLNVTYIVPMSRFLKTDNIEVHLSSDKPLLWSICSNEQDEKSSSSVIAEQEDDDDDRVVESQPQNLITIVKQRNNDKIILGLSIPSRGYFLRNFMLRASTELDQKKLCDHDAHLANTLLQYNFRIVRDCD